jgi:hypothetical protein
MDKKEPKFCPQFFPKKKPCLGQECAWWIEMKDSSMSNCSIPHLVLVNIELLQRTVGVQQAVESSRNETIKRQDAAIQRQDAFLEMIQPVKRIR